MNNVTYEDFVNLQQSNYSHENLADIMQRLDLFIKKYVRKYNKCYTEFDDALQYARLVVFEALQEVDVEKYNEAQIFSFIIKKVRFTVKDVNLKNKVDGLSTSYGFGKLINKIEAIYYEQKEKGKKDITMDDIQHHFSCSKEQLKIAWDYFHKGRESLLSLCHETGVKSNEPERNFIDPEIKGKFQTDDCLLRLELERLMDDCLTEKQKDILCRFYGWDGRIWKQKEIALLYDMNETSVQANIRRSRHAMRDEAKRRNLDDYLCK